MSDEEKKETTEVTPEATEVVETLPVETPVIAPVEEPVVEATPEEVPPPEASVKVIPHKDIKAGMTIRLHEKINDLSPKGEKRERLQVFEGIVMNVRGAADSRTMTIRKMSGTVGVEKIFPLSSPNIAKIEVVKVAKTRRGNLSFLKGFRRKLKEVWMKK